MRRRSAGAARAVVWLGLSLAVPGVLSNGGTSAGAARAERPHIVLAVADDTGWNNVGWHARGNAAGAEVSTPVLDSLVAAGVELDRAIAFKYCAPSRCALYSGRNPAHVNVDNDVFASGTGIPENMTTLATKLKLLAGYRTVFAGKWHAGMRSSVQTPRGRGFDAALSYFNPDNDYWSSVYSSCPLNRSTGNGTPPAPVTDLWEAVEGGGEGPAYSRPNSCPDQGRFVPTDGCADLLGRSCAHEWDAVVGGGAAGPRRRCVECAVGVNAPGCSVAIIDRWCQGYRPYVTGARCTRGNSTGNHSEAPGLYEERMLAEYAVARIAEHNDSSSPLFLVYAAHSAHAPLQAPADTLARFDGIAARGDKPEHSRQIYTAMVAEADAAIGSIVTALKAGQMWTSTLLVWVSDNGGPSYLNGTSGANNFPLTGGKMSNYEGGIRVASFMAGGWLPAHRRGVKYTQLVAIWDWYAILGSVAGIPAAAMQADPAAARAGLPGVDAIDLTASLVYGEQRMTRQKEQHRGRDSPPAVATRTQMCIGTANRSQQLVAGVYLDTNSDDASATTTRTLYKLLVGIQNQAAHSAPLSPNGTMNATLGFPAPGRAWTPDLNGHDCGEQGCLYEVLSDPTEARDLAAEQPAVLLKMHAILAACRATSLVRVIGPVDEAACAAAEGRGWHWGPWV